MVNNIITQTREYNNKYVEIGIRDSYLRGSFCFFILLKFGFDYDEEPNSDWFVVITQLECFSSWILPKKLPYILLKD